MQVNNIDSLVMNNINLVHGCMRGIKIPRLLDYEDLFQSGCEGLIQASKRYNAKKGTCFSTYAYKYIKGYILRTINKNINIVHIPVCKVLAQKNDSSDSAVNVVYMNDSSWDVGDISRHVAVNTCDDVENNVDYYLLKRTINKFGYKLAPRQIKALDIYYNNFTTEGRNSFKIVGDALGISGEGARQLVKRGISNLRKVLNSYDV